MKCSKTCRHRNDNYGGRIFDSHFPTSGGMAGHAGPCVEAPGSVRVASDLEIRLPHSNHMDRVG